MGAHIKAWTVKLRSSQLQLGIGWLPILVNDHNTSESGALAIIMEDGFCTTNKASNGSI